MSRLTSVSLGRGGEKGRRCLQAGPEFGNGQHVKPDELFLRSLRIGRDHGKHLCPSQIDVHQGHDYQPRKSQLSSLFLKRRSQDVHTGIDQRTDGDPNRNNRHPDDPPGIPISTR